MDLRMGFRSITSRRVLWLLVSMLACARGTSDSAAPAADVPADETMAPPPVVIRFAPAAGGAGVPARISSFCQPAEPAKSTPPVRVDTADFARAPRALMRLSIESYFETAVRCVVRNQVEWDRVRPLTSNRPDSSFPHAPAVDFGREMLIVAGAGARPSFFYEIQIDGTWVRGDTLVASVTTISPVGETALDVGTSPAVVVKVPR
ncbi:MAG TPA: protease complex subunit PrcB family protein, partial [Longimicrobium sp.]|nr:protease complex subunit PrcB family protein [Longimicrobium sp.]